jgi:O-methyltransferase
VPSLRELVRDARKLAIGWRWRAGYVLGTPVPSHYDDDLAATVKRVRRHTLTSAPRIASLCDSVEYLVREGIEGDVVECGVWRGGSMMAAALTLNRLGDADRELYLFDTFDGMTEPGDADVPSPYDGYSMHKRWRRHNRSGTAWAGVPVAEVEANLASTGYRLERVHCVRGKVEDTLPDEAPKKIALLRLDTDWYESTKHELVHLYPRLVEGGVLIVDDYGHYEGARRAVNEYFRETGQPVFLTRIDWTGRLAVKQPRVGAASSGD